MCGYPMDTLNFQFMEPRILWSRKVSFAIYFIAFLSSTSDDLQSDCKYRYANKSHLSDIGCVWKIIVFRFEPPFVQKGQLHIWTVWIWMNEYISGADKKKLEIKFMNLENCFGHFLMISISYLQPFFTCGTQCYTK